MYPQLLQSDNREIREAAQAFMDEMGHISKAFSDYKERFNTKTKICSNPRAFLQETAAVSGAITARIEREDAALYPLL